MLSVSRPIPHFTLGTGFCLSGRRIRSALLPPRCNGCNRFIVSDFRRYPADCARARHVAHRPILRRRIFVDEGLECIAGSSTGETNFEGPLLCSIHESTTLKSSPMMCGVESCVSKRRPHWRRNKEMGFLRQTVVQQRGLQDQCKFDGFHKNSPVSFGRDPRAQDYDA